MGRFAVTHVDVSHVMLENILTFMEGETFSKDLSAKIVGGPKRLEDLIASGEICATKRVNSRNGKWYCNAAQVLRHCRNMRK